MTSAPIYQTRWSHPETVWGDVSKDVYDKYETFGYVERRIVYLEPPAPIAPAEEAYDLQFPVSLRKMWAGWEVQKWLDDLPPLFTHPAAAQPSRAQVLEEAARVCEKRAEDRFQELGTTEPDTGASYYSGRAAEEYGARDEEDEDCAAAIRALKAKP